jgi:hypothetical protein
LHAYSVLPAAPGRRGNELQVEFKLPSGDDESGWVDSETMNRDFNSPCHWKPLERPGPGRAGLRWQSPDLTWTRGRPRRAESEDRERSLRVRQGHWHCQWQWTPPAMPLAALSPAEPGRLPPRRTPMTEPTPPRSPPAAPSLSGSCHCGSASKSMTRSHALAAATTSSEPDAHDPASGRG